MARKNHAQSITIVERVNKLTHDDQYRVIRELNSRLFDAVSPVLYFKAIIEKLNKELGYDIK